MKFRDWWHECTVESWEGHKFMRKLKFIKSNATFIAMVPKKSQTFKISDYRPISLVTSLYKIIAKVLSRRLRKVLHETIFGSQGAFVEGRQILDVVLIANEVVDEKRRSGVVFKIDFEEAYDHVDWGFLDHVLQRKGFS